MRLPFSIERLENTERKKRKYFLHFDFGLFSSLRTPREFCLNLSFSHISFVSRLAHVYLRGRSLFFNHLELISPLRCRL